MGMVSAIIALATAALKVWGTKLARKYLDELNEIENTLNELYGAEYLLRDHAAIDHYEFKLRQCLRNIATDLGKQDAVA